jgi:tetratricopeptide (TPR) repeat protein
MLIILKMDQLDLPPDDLNVADDLMSLGGVASRTNRPAEAQQRWRSALVIYEKSLGANAAETALCRSNLAMIDAQLGNKEDAGMPSHESTMVQDPKAMSGQEQGVRALDELAVKLANEGRLKEAEEKYRAALALAEKHGNEDAPGLALALRQLGVFLSSTERFEEAEPLLVRALSLQEKSLGPRHPDLVPTLNVLAQLLIAERRPTEGEQMLRRAIGLGVERDGVRDPEVTRAMETLGLYLQNNKRLPEALSLQREIVSNIAASFGKENEGYAQALSNLATTLMALERYDEAERVFQEIVDIGEKLPPDTPAMADWLNNFAVLRMNERKKTEADFLFQRALGILFRASSRSGTDLPHLQGTIGSYTVFLKSIGLDPLTAEDRVERIRRGEDVPSLWK